MSTKKYVVCPGRSCSIKGSLLRAGTQVPSDVPPKTIKEWENSGFIRRVGGEASPGDDRKGVIKSEVDVRKDGEDTVKEAKQTVSQPGKFNLDPDKLSGKSLDELNIILVDMNADPADTVPEAIGLLSADRGD